MSTTYIQQEQTTFIEAMRDYRDQIGDLSGFSIVEDDLGNSGSPNESLPYLGISTPYRDDLRLRLREDYQRSIYHYLGHWDGGSFSSMDSKQVGAATHSSYEMAWDHTVEYWHSYSDDHSVFFIRRVEGEGRDGACWFGAQVVDKLWPYNQANIYETDWVHAAYGTNSSSSGFDTGAGAVQQGGEGAVNPDASFNNYVWNEGLVESYAYVVSESNYRTLIGSYDAWITDESGTNADSGDVVQDDQANDVYEILKYHEVNPVGIKMG